MTHLLLASQGCILLRRSPDLFVPTKPLLLETTKFVLADMLFAPSPTVKLISFPDCQTTAPLENMFVL